MAHNKEWVKGHFRRGQALQALGDLSGAAAAHEEAARLGAGTDASKELLAAAKAARAAADEEAERTGGSKQPEAAKIGDVAGLQAALAADLSLIGFRGKGTSDAVVGNTATHWAAASPN